MANIYHLKYQYIKHKYFKYQTIFKMSKSLRDLLIIVKKKDQVFTKWSILVQNVTKKV